MLSGPHPQGHKEPVCTAQTDEFPDPPLEPLSLHPPGANEVRSVCFLQGLLLCSQGRALVTPRARQHLVTEQLTLQCCIAITGQQLSDQLSIILIFVQPPGGEMRGC